MKIQTSFLSDFSSSKKKRKYSYYWQNDWIEKNDYKSVCHIIQSQILMHIRLIINHMKSDLIKSLDYNYIKRQSFKDFGAV